MIVATEELGAIRFTESSGYADIWPPLSPFKYGILPLKMGDKGSKVKLLQLMLNQAGHKVSITGIFDSATESAVKIFQMSSGLTPDGWVGKLTWKKLEKAVERPKPPAPAPAPTPAPTPPPQTLPPTYRPIMPAAPTPSIAPIMVIGLIGIGVLLLLR